MTSHPFGTDWLFGPASAGSDLPGFDDSGFAEVTLPHTVVPLSVVDPGLAVDWGDHDAPDQPPSPFPPRSFRSRLPHGALVHHEPLSWLVPPSGGRITHLAGVLGRGLGREITRLVVAWGFGDLGLHRIKLEVLAFNISSADIPCQIV